VTTDSVLSKDKTWRVSFVLEKPEQFDEMMWECAKGNISTEDAAKKCGMKLETFYSWLRKNNEAYALFRQNVGTRQKSVMPVDLFDKLERKRELLKERKAQETMKKYGSKSHINIKVQMAKAMGMSYGQYVAFADGLGKL
jgi:transposase